MSTYTAYWLPEGLTFRTREGTLQLAIPAKEDSHFVQKVLYSKLVQGDLDIYGEKDVTHSKVVGILHPTSTPSYNGMKVTFKYPSVEQCGYDNIYYEMESTTYWGWSYTGHLEYADPSLKPRPFRGSVAITWLSETSTSAYIKLYYMQETWDWDRGIWQPTDGIEHRRCTKRTELLEYPNLDYDLIIHKVLAANPQDAGRRSQLFRNAVDSMKMDQNMIANSSELYDLAATIKDLCIKGPTKALTKALGRLDSTHKVAADAWLSYRYAVSTTRMDINEWADKKKLITDSSAHTIRSGYSENGITEHVKVVLQDQKQNSMAELHRSLMRFGAAVTPYNLWDLVPFSFVVDWFCPIGDLLHEFDYEFYLHSSYFDVKSVTMSRKIVKEVDVGLCKLYVTIYIREVQQTVPTLCWYQEDPSTKTVNTRVLDAAALIIG